MSKTKKFEGILLCGDFDNTLRSSEFPDAPISKENAEAIRYFQENGGYFTLITGRHPHYTRQYQQNFTPNAPVAGYHGALIAEPRGDAFLYDLGQNDTRMFDVIAGLWESDPAIVKVHCNGARAESYKCRRDGTGHYPDPETMRQNIPLPIYALLVVTEEGHELRMKAIMEDRIAALGLFDRFEVTRPGFNGCEIIRRGCDKGGALLRLKEMTGARLTVAMGDFDNDIPMIRAADIGYAVANAVPALKEAADRVTVDCKDHAAAAVIADLEHALIG